MFDAPDVEMGMGEPGQPDATAFTAVKSEPGADSMDGVQVSPQKAASEKSDAPSKASDQASVEGQDSSAQSPSSLPPQNSACICAICRKRVRADKSKHCKICKSDVQAARREADSRGEAKWFAELLKRGGEELTDFMHTYVQNSGERRKFTNRTRFDFCRYREARRVQTAFKLGFKAPRIKSWLMYVHVGHGLCS